MIILNADINIQKIIAPVAADFLASSDSRNVDMITGADYFLPGENGSLKTYDEQAHGDFERLAETHPDAQFIELAKTQNGFKLFD